MADLLRRPVAVIVGNTPAALAAKAATTTVPIVFVTGGDPVRVGLVASLNRPGGNVTGVSFISVELGAKQLGLLRELRPGAARIAVLVDPKFPTTERFVSEVRAAASAIGQQIEVLYVSSDREIETAFTTLVQRGAGALLGGTGGFLLSHRERIVALAARHRIPAIYILRDYVAAGGLMSYAPSITDAYRQAGIYAGRILKGEKPGDLPVMLPTKFELVINLKTAKALGLDVPDKLLALRRRGDRMKRREFITPLDGASRLLGRSWCAGKPAFVSIIGLLRHSAGSNRPPNSARARPIRSRRVAHYRRPASA